MSKNSVIGCSVVASLAMLAVIAAIVWPILLVDRAHDERIREYDRANAQRIQYYSADDVTSIHISLFEDSVKLDPKKDREDIERLIDSLKHVTVDNRKRDINTSGTLLVLMREKPGVINSIEIMGNFDPDNAPLVTRYLRSDDLGQVIYDIFKRKGLRPELKHPSVENYRSFGSGKSGDARAQTQFIQHYRAADVRRITINLHNDRVDLDPKKDRADIERLMDSLRRVTVGKQIPGPIEYQELIVVAQKPGEGSGMTEIKGDFNPDHAPRITEYLRSDDLGRIIYDIYRHKGLRPEIE